MLLYEASMKKQVDMTNGPLGKKIILFTIPLLITGIFQQMFNACDVAVVGQFAGKEAMAAVGSNSPVIALLINLFIGISLGTNVVIAKAIGQKNEDRVGKAVHTSILISIIAGIALIILGEIFAAKAIGALGVPDEVYPLALLYLRIYLLGMPVILLYNFETAIFRSCGNTKTPLMALMASGVINVVLNMIFVILFNMSVAGVAIATVTANLVSSVILFVNLIKTDLDIKFSFKKLKIDVSTLKEILRIGVPSGIQSMIFSFANIIIQSAVNSLGTTIMAASAAAFNLEIFSFYVMNSFNQSCTTFVGQNFGAGKLDRCLKSLKICLLQCFVCTAIFCTTILMFAKPLLGIFNPDPDVIASGIVRLRYIFFAYTFSFAQETTSGYLRGFGLSFLPAICSIVGICGIRLFWIFVVFPKYPSFETIMQVYPISLGLTAVAIVLSALIVKPSKKFAGENKSI